MLLRLGRIHFSDGSRRRWVLLAICLGYFMTILDTTIVNVALEDLARHLGASVSGLQWIVDAYALTFASLLLTAGALGDRFGNKHMFLVGLIVFTLASVVCGAATSLRMLVFFRVLQGLGAALLVPPSLALLRGGFVDPAARARAIGIWAAVAGTAAAAGPVIGGVLIATFSWRSIFWVNLPVGFFAMLLTVISVKPEGSSVFRKLDVAGLVLGVVGLGALTFVLIEGHALGWTSPAVGMVALIAFAALLAFVLVERRVETPMLPLALFEERTFLSANGVGCILNFGFYGELFVLSLYFQTQRGYSPLRTGLALLAQTGMLLGGNLISGRWTSRRGPRGPMAVGMALGCAGFACLLGLGPNTAYAWMVVPLIAIGFGTALTMPAMTAAILEVTPESRSGMGSGVLTASRQVGGVLGIAVMGMLMNGPQGLMSGVHIAMAIASASYFAGAVFSLKGIP